MKKTLAKVDIIIKSRDPVFGIKAQLSQCLAPANAEKTTAVFLSIVGEKNITKVELPQKYCLDEVDVSKLRRIEKVIDVEAAA